MIYLADDYVTKYGDTLTYLLGKAYDKSYSFDYIQKTISYSQMINEFEKSNVTIIAFTPMERIYDDIFPKHESNYEFNPYNIFGWCGYVYAHLFLKMEITFEALFYLIPLEEMLRLYHLYHEMSITQIEDYASETLKYSILDIVMKAKKISNKKLSEKTGVSVSTINALRYGKRNIAKLEADKLLLIANCLNVKMETLLPSIHLEFLK